jgi:hypothetical protein
MAALRAYLRLYPLLARRDETQAVLRALGDLSQFAFQELETREGTARPGVSLVAAAIDRLTSGTFATMEDAAAALRKKAVSAQSLTDPLTTFGDLYREALPEEKRELIRLRVNVWTPDEIRLALLDSPPACQRLGESPQLVAQRPDSLNR